jgi:hypothetical protein
MKTAVKILLCLVAPAIVASIIAVSAVNSMHQAPADPRDISGGWGYGARLDAYNAAQNAKGVHP